MTNGPSGTQMTVCKRPCSPALIGSAALQLIANARQTMISVRTKAACTGRRAASRRRSARSARPGGTRSRSSAGATTWSTSPPSTTPRTPPSTRCAFGLASVFLRACVRLPLTLERSQARHGVLDRGQQLVEGLGRGRLLPHHAQRRRLRQRDRRTAPEPVARAAASGHAPGAAVGRGAAAARQRPGEGEERLLAAHPRPRAPSAGL